MRLRAIFAIQAKKAQPCFVLQIPAKQENRVEYRIVFRLYRHTFLELKLSFSDA